MSRTEFRFSGFGGQGVITMAHVLGHGASVHADMDATLTEAYGPEKTGGFSRGDVVVSDEPIDYPNVVDPDVVVGFSQDAFERDAETVTEDGLVVIERDLVDPEPLVADRPDVTVASLAAVDLAEELGRQVVANVLMLGAIVELVGSPPFEAVRDAVRETVPDGTEDLNEHAFERGRTAVDADELQYTADNTQEAMP
jgi:2-oxoglutarate ferredoxin oxidoreductase subunit gamma